MGQTKTDVAGSGYGNIFVDSLVWGGSAWDLSQGPITYFFGSFIDYSSAQAAYYGSDWRISSSGLSSWTSAERGAFGRAMKLYEEVSNLTFAPATSAATANLVWWKYDYGDQTLLGQHDLPNSAGKLWGVFNPDAASWKYQKSGGDGFTTIVHELGHGLGLAHPHDGGNASDATSFPGVSDSSDTGSYGLNQGIWTTMSYNVGWDAAGSTLSYGGQGGLGAFDIAAIQALYGANMTTRTGRDTYALPLANVAGTGWSTIWDAGGSDTISAGATTLNAVIDLRPANLQPTSNRAGGYPSYLKGIDGGFTIASGVLVENAIGGSGNDYLIGNNAANLLKGGSGIDVLAGLKGNDTLVGSGGRDIFRFNTAPSAGTNVDKILDFAPGFDRIQIDDAFYKAGPRGTLAAPAFCTTTSSKLAHDASDRIVYQSTTGKLFYDSDGTGAGAAVQFASVTAGLKLAATDFIII